MFKYLKDFGILGNNARITDFILPHNKRSAYPYVDNKILTHKLALENGISSPDLYFTLQTFGDTRGLHFLKTLRQQSLNRLAARRVMVFWCLTKFTGTQIRAKPIS